jgi:2-aminoadipate transaminase
VSLNNDIDAQALLQEAIANGVAYVHGSEFRYEGGVSSDLRLSFSSVDADHMDEAIRRLAETIVQHEHRASDDVSRQSR